MLSLKIVICYIIINARAQQHECNDMSDCSYNGICNKTTNTCICFPQWKNTHCTELNLIPGSKNLGLKSIRNGSISSTWGGPILKDPTTNIYHMIAAEMTYSCGIQMWLSNSMITHSSIKDPLSKPFSSTTDIVHGIFSHEPTFIQALDTKEYVIYFSNTYPPKTNGKTPCYDCHNGETSEYCSTSPYYANNVSLPCPTKMIYSKNIDGPWSDMIDIPMMYQPLRPADSNFVAYIFPNGSLTGIGRYANVNHTDDDLRGYYVTKASNWKDNNTYINTDITYNYPISPGEDPYLWYDIRYDVFHSLWHFGNETAWGYPFGMHAFSIDGGYNWKLYPDEFAYQGHVEFTDSDPIDLVQRERPHLLLDDDGYTPIALTNAVVESNNGDHSYTLLVPIGQS
eukprot:213560_1